MLPKNSCVTPWPKGRDTANVIRLQADVKFNFGGHLNHSLLWPSLASLKNRTQPQGTLRNAVLRDFHSVDILATFYLAAAAGIRGSGWCWLGLNPISRVIEIATCRNEDSLQATTGLVPLLGIDVWEHAFYGQFRTNRADYLRAIWQIVNWQTVRDRLDSCNA